jgi:hypothetical protein
MQLCELLLDELWKMQLGKTSHSSNIMLNNSGTIAVRKTLSLERDSTQSRDFSHQTAMKFM